MPYNPKFLRTELKKQLPGILFDEPLAKYSTFHIGGPADFFYKLQHTEELSSLMKFCNINEIPYYILGGGSNILFHDKGFRGLIIKIDTKNITIQNNTITADAGVSIARLIGNTVINHLTGLEKWTGLPGTVGGAISGNAGCNGLEVKDVLLQALLLNPKTGKIKSCNNKYFHFAYRYSKLRQTGEIALSCTFKISKLQSSPEKQKALIKEMHKKRLAKQPFGLTCGSFFRNPSPETPAGLLIEKVGLKGKTIGKAQISPKHGNFFLNLGGAKVKDILKLAALAQKKVKAKFGLELETEVQIVPPCSLHVHH